MTSPQLIVTGTTLVETVQHPHPLATTWNGRVVVSRSVRHHACVHMEVGTAVAVADSLGVSHIAIVDDDVPIRQVLTEALTDEGLSVVVWDGHEEPLAFIERTQPAVIILDLRLSGWVSHWAIIDALRDGKGGLRIPIIVCTADTAFVREHRDELERLSCAVVEKPFDLDVLLREVHRCLALSVR